MTNVSKNLFICLATHLCTVAIEYFLTEPRPYVFAFWTYRRKILSHYLWKIFAD